MEERFFKFDVLSKFPEVIHGISTRNYHNMSFYRGDQEKVAKNREYFLGEMGILIDNVVVPEIVHGSKIFVISSVDKGKGAKDSVSDIKDADGLVTCEKGVYLMVTVADCFPIFAYDSVLGAVGLAHAGWRGIASGVVTNLIHKMEDVGCQKDNILFSVGPGICQKHFVVRNDVLAKFLRRYPQATFVRNKDGYVDLRKVVLSDFCDNHISDHNIEVSSICPACQNGIFGSFRMEGDRVPFSAAVIGLKDI